MLRLIVLYLSITAFILLETNFVAAAQTAALPIDEWVEKLGEKADVDNNDFREIDYGLITQCTNRS